MSNKMPWFRMYARIVDDEKLRLLAFEDRWHFVALCCLKNDGLLDELDSDLRSRKIAVKLGVQVRELDEISRRLKEVNLIDDNLSPIAWDDLQYKSDNSTDRVKKFREKQQRNSKKRSGNVSVTAQETETDTDTEENIGASDEACASGDALKVEHLFEEWNATAKQLSLPQARGLTPSRRQLLKYRLGQYTLDDFAEVFAKIKSSRFLRGDRGSTPCKFDWVFQRKNFQKILEGNYDD